MDLYDVVITPRAESQLLAYADYIVYTLLNEGAAKSLIQDARETQESLSKAAGSLQYCRNPILKRRGFRAICFRRHNYIMLYRIIDKTAYVEAIYHQSQDYENLFIAEIK